MTIGKVYLVGAGPGDPGLITVKGRECLGSADVVLYDRLVDSRLLDLLRRDTEVINVGKSPGEKKVTQAQINRTMVENARHGKTVVRLKGGDPFLFGRGGEEGKFLHDNKIPFEVVPGVSSVAAVPAYAGIPLTHRGIASSFTVIAGDEDSAKVDSDNDWGVIARQHGTLVVVMGLRNLANITKTLINYGKNPDTPVAVIEWGTENYQKTQISTLKHVAKKVKDAGVDSPVIIVIGDVVNLRESLNWFDNKPLFGKRILVTRARPQASEISRLIELKGAISVEVPAIQINPPGNPKPLSDTLTRIGDYDWIIFVSINSVEAVQGWLDLNRASHLAFNDLRVGAVGPGTSARLKQLGIVPDFVPAKYTTEAIVQEMKTRNIEGLKILVPRADISPKTLLNGLKSLGARVDEVTAYRTVVPSGMGPAVRDALTGGIDVITLTSSSAIRNLLGSLYGDLKAISNCVVACIGPVTATTAQELGLEPDIVADEHTIEGLVDAIESYFTAV